MLRRLLAFGAMTIVLATVFVIGDAPSAGACSCMTRKPQTSTFVGRVASVNGDLFSFVDVVMKSGDNVNNPVVVNISAGRKPDAKGVRTSTSCDVGGDQPLLGGVYQVTIDPLVPSISSCGGSFSLVEAPPAGMIDVTQPPEPDSSDSSRPTVALVLGAVLLVIAGGMVFQQRRRRTA